MPVKIDKPAIFEDMGNKPILIKEYFGKVNSNTDEVSIAHLKCPGHWIEPGQMPEFDEYTVVLNGTLRITTKEQFFDVNAGEAILTEFGEWIQYSTPTDEGAEYIAVCLPAFSMERANREEQQ
jgi:mannose-6-phosphate isomerase-like protein (cupin superfamily)